MQYLNFCKKYGPWALVAGGSAGLGAAYSEALARRGLNLIIIAREKKRLEETAARIKEKYSVDVIAMCADLADFENIKKLIAELLSAENNKMFIGLMVYNAAFAPITSFENTSEEHLSLAANINVRTPLLLAKFLSERMIQNKRGGIVLMSSLAGSQGSLKLASYAATKAFNSILAESLWKELKPHGIDVISCRAGAILTPCSEQTKNNKSAPDSGKPNRAKLRGSMTAADVAEQTLKALGKKPVIVSGKVKYKIIPFQY